MKEAMTDIMEPTRIATQLAQIQRDPGVSDDMASNALRQAVKLLKAAVPFMLPIPIVTGDRSPLDIAQEDSEEPYARILFAWYADLITHPAWEMDEVSHFVSEVRSAVNDQIASFLERRQGTIPLSLRKLTQTECDLCDDVMIRWLSLTNRVRLFELALLWDLQSASNATPGVLEELGLTGDWMLELPESELIRLRVVERIEAENKQYLADLWNFICGDPRGVELKQHVFDATNRYSVTHGESL
jgi:hypothetical protein